MKLKCLIGLLILLSAISGCERPSLPEIRPSSSGRSSATDFVLPQDPKGITTAPVRVRPLPDFLEIAARIQPDPTRVVRVFAPVSGRLISVEVRPGDRVRKGQTLAVLESSEISAARADYQKAQADAELKEQALRRASLLYEHQVLPEKDYQQARADAEIATAELERAREHLRILNVDPNNSSDQIRMTALRDGVVLDIGAAPGEFSKSLDAPAPLCTLADLSTVWAVGDVYEKDLTGLKVGLPATVVVNAYPREKWTGRVAAISNTVDPATRTLKVRIVLPNPGLRLKPEMFASIRLLRSTRPGIGVPASSIVREGAASYVFVERAAGHFERRPVTLGRTFDNAEVEVSAGLKPGEIVVVEGALLLRAAAS